MKKRTVITTEKREVWVIREGSADSDLAKPPDAITSADEVEEPEVEQLERNKEP